MYVIISVLNGIHTPLFGEWGSIDQIQTQLEYISKGVIKDPLISLATAVIIVDCEHPNRSFRMERKEPV